MSSEGRAFRDHHCTSAASHSPANGSASRTRCNSSVANANASHPDALISRTDMSISLLLVRYGHLRAQVYRGDKR